MPTCSSILYSTGCTHMQSESWSKRETFGLFFREKQNRSALACWAQPNGHICHTKLQRAFQWDFCPLLGIQFIQQIFSELLPCARHYSRHGGNRCEPHRQNFMPSLGLPPSKTFNQKKKTPLSYKQWVRKSNTIVDLSFCNCGS